MAQGFCPHQLDCKNASLVHQASASGGILVVQTSIRIRKAHYLLGFEIRTFHVLFQSFIPDHLPDKEVRRRLNCQVDSA